MTMSSRTFSPMSVTAGAIAVRQSRPTRWRTFAARPSVPRVRRTDMLLRALPAPALLLCALAPLFCAGAVQAEENPFVEVPGAEFRSALPAGKAEVVPIRTFLLQRHPVTNGEFLAFVTGHPEWRRGTAPALLFDDAAPT